VSQRLFFPEGLRLKSRKQIEQLFKQADSSFAFPLLLKYKIPTIASASLPEEAAPQFAVSVSKKSFKRACDRNTIKRRIREAYRLHWQDYISGQSIHMMFIYVGKSMPDYPSIERSLLRILKNLRNNIPNNIT